jgi:hypothetical protein
MAPKSTDGPRRDGQVGAALLECDGSCATELECDAERVGLRLWWRASDFVAFGAVASSLIGRSAKASGRAIGASECSCRFFFPRHLVWAWRVFN